MSYITQLSNWNNGVMRSLMTTDSWCTILSQHEPVHWATIANWKLQWETFLGGTRSGKRSVVVGVGLLNVLIIQIFFISCLEKITKDNCLFRVKRDIVWGPNVVSWSFHGKYFKNGVLRGNFVEISPWLHRTWKRGPLGISSRISWPQLSCCFCQGAACAWT